MRIVNGIFALLLVVFAAVQLNDPDGLQWMIIYGVGAIWCGLAALRPAAFLKSPAWVLFLLTFAAAVVGLIYYWPKSQGWWQMAVWWETETAREGMGMMILVVALLLAGTAARAVRRAR